MLSSKQKSQLHSIAKNTELMINQPISDDVAFVVLMRICRDYVNPYTHPFLTNECRDKWLIERLQKYQIRFFQKI